MYSRIKTCFTLFVIVCITLMEVPTFADAPMQEHMLTVQQMAYGELTSQRMSNAICLYLSDSEASGLCRSDIYELYYGPVFNIPRINDDLTVTIPDNLCYCPIIMDERIVALLRFCYTDDGGLQYVISAGYCDILNGIENEKVFFYEQSLYAEHLVHKDHGNEQLLDVIEELPVLEHSSLVSRSGLSIGEMIDSMGTGNHSVEAMFSYIGTGTISPNSVVSFPNGKRLGNYPVVAQGDNPWCWAATISSIVRYEQSSSTPSMADVQSYAGLSYGATLTQAKNILSHYLTSPYIPTKYGRAMIQNEIKTIIGNNDPALMDAHSSGSGHMTALNGYMTIDDTMAIRMMNPGTGQFEWTGYTFYAFTFSYNGKTWYWDGTVRLLYE